jgi:penicillin-binding protein 1B
MRRITALFLLGGGLALGYLAGGAIVRLDQIVVSRFEGQRFRVPSRVLSAPTILYPGADWKRIDLPGALARLGYRESAGDDLAPGQMRWGGDRVRIHLRAFDHPSRPEPSRDILISLSGSQIEEIRDVHARRELGAVLLEPELVGSYYGPDREQRELVRIGEVPRHLVDAILAVEDQRFDRHHGIDPWRIVGALWANLRAGSIRQGGSTLTQQLVKNFFLTPERTLRRKLEEATMALLVEGRYDKDSILECYLNEIYLGQRGTVEVHGIGEASRLYFGKPARELDLAESALLAAIIPGPNRISPHRDPERTRARRNLVLDLMEQQGRIDPASAEAARAQPIHVARVTPEPAEARYFLDVLRRQLPQVYDSDVLTTEGMRIYSSLDLRLQKLAAAALREGIASLEKRYPKLVSKDPQNALQGCLVALRPQTGEVLALVGGRDYGTSQFDRCTQARRQAGSVFKPFVYLAALEPTDGGPAITLASQLDDAPLSISTPSGPWRPANFDRAFHGTVSVRAALERSMNVATARLAQNVGIERVADLARRSGIESPLALVPSLALGVADVAPIEIARAYATIANGGIRPDIRTFEDVVDAEGDTLARRDIEFERVLDAGTAYLTTSLLEGVIDHGTGAAVRAAGLRGPIAGKTGTTDQERDAWFAGFTPELVVVVWVGFDAPRSIGLSGSSAALPIWARFVRDVTGGEVRGAFLPPPEVISVDIEPGSGALALSGCPERKPELFLLGTEPTRVCPARGVFEHASEPGEGPRSRPAPARRRGFLDWLRDVL